MTDAQPVKLFDAGYTDLISVIPPSAQLSPGSKVSAASLGKAPGKRLSNGLWAGYAWRTHQATREEVKAWAMQGANVGLRAGRFPGLDIDSLDADIVARVQGLAHEIFGYAPVRVGRAPKALLMYRLRDGAEAIGRMRMWFEKDGKTHLLELLGEGQQYLVYGVHPTTKLPYTWAPEPPAASALRDIDQERAEALFQYIQQTLERDGFTVRREGDGRKVERAKTAVQDELLAPSLEQLQVAVSLIPNTDALFPGREEYIKVGAAIKAACGEQLEEGFEVFAEWASRHEADGRVTGNPETWATDWKRLYPPFAVGWGWLASLARGYGFTDAADDFEPVADAVPPPTMAASAPLTPRLSDQYLAREVIRRVGSQLRFVPATDKWLVWDGGRWRPDNMLLAQGVVGDALHAIASAELTAAGAQPPTRVVNEAKRIESAHVLFDVLRLVRADRSIAVDAALLDKDPWLLNTPAGIVDLRTGELRRGTPADLMTKCTAAAPDASHPTPVWSAFVHEATKEDPDLIAFLRRFGGYCLTGLTSEQVFVFLYGEGGRGKGTYAHTLRMILGDYATPAGMETFTASNYDRHTTELASLAGTRLVVAAETQEGRRWDEQRVKLMTGGDAIKARFMRQDDFVFEPTFKLLFLGNYRPQVRGLDEAMKRRTVIVPFEVLPKQKIPDLREVVLVPEWPGILAWFVQGAKEWHAEGLNAPARVRVSTEDYFEDEDLVGRFLKERCERDPNATTRSADVFQAWREWAGEAGEYVGSLKRLVHNLQARGFGSGRNAAGRGVLKGITVKPDLEPVAHD